MSQRTSTVAPSAYSQRLTTSVLQTFFKAKRGTALSIGKQAKRNKKQTYTKQQQRLYQFHYLVLANGLA